MGGGWGPSQPASAGCSTREPHSQEASLRGASPCHLPVPTPRPLGLSLQPSPASPPGPHRVPVGGFWRQLRKIPSLPPTPSSSPHIELAISVSATLSGLRQGRGWRDRVLLSRWCTSVSSFMSLCFSCPVLLLAPSLTLRETPVGDSRTSLGHAAAY